MNLYFQKYKLTWNFRSWAITSNILYDIFVYFKYQGLFLVLSKIFGVSSSWLNKTLMFLKPNSITEKINSKIVLLKISKIIFCHLIFGII